MGDPITCRVEASGIYHQGQCCSTAAISRAPRDRDFILIVVNNQLGPMITKGAVSAYVSKFYEK
jgi:hypothetical protein